MNYQKYMVNNKYDLGNNDCWTLMQDIFKDEHDLELPDLPIFDAPDVNYLKTNVKHKKVDNAQKGCLVHVWNKKIQHVGYAINSKQYIHKTYTGVIVAVIPKNAYIYEVLDD